MTAKQARPAGRASFETALRAYGEARFAQARSALESLLRAGRALEPTVLLLARCELRAGNPSGALALLASHGTALRSRGAKTEASMLGGVAFARLGDRGSSQSHFSRAVRLAKPGDAIVPELTYHRAAAAWIERRLGEAERILTTMPNDRDAGVELQTRILRGAIASANEELALQGAILLDALRFVRTGAAVSEYFFAVLVTQIAALSVELPSAELFEAASEEVSSVRWTSDIADLHFHALRALGWRHALEGDDFGAFRRLKEALAVTTSPAWRVAALTDRAYLANALGEKRWAAQELRDAHDLAGGIDWTTVQGEEKLALPVLAELFASRDAAVAMSYSAAFQNVGRSYPRVLSSNNDRRVQALHDLSLGTVQAALGETAEAKRLLTRAYKAYEQLAIQWRAARCAKALWEITGDPVWRSRAAALLAAYPRSWLARTGAAPPGGAPVTLSPALQKLTPAQRAVFDLIMDGKNTAQIAKALGRSSFTVRNHVKAIFKAFGVASKPALIVKATTPTLE